MGCDFPNCPFFLAIERLGEPLEWLSTVAVAVEESGGEWAIPREMQKDLAGTKRRGSGLGAEL